MVLSIISLLIQKIKKLLSNSIISIKKTFSRGNTDLVYRNLFNFCHITVNKVLSTGYEFYPFLSHFIFYIR